MRKNRVGLRREIQVGLIGVVSAFLIYDVLPTDQWLFNLVDIFFLPEAAKEPFWNGSSSGIIFNTADGYYTTFCQLLLPRGNPGFAYGCWGYPKTGYFYYIFVILFGIVIPIIGRRALSNISVLTFIPKRFLIVIFSFVLAIILTIYVHNLIPTVMYALFDVPPTGLLYGDIVSAEYPYPTLFNNGVVYFITNTFQIVFFGIFLTTLMIIFGLMIDPLAVMAKRLGRNALTDMAQATQEFKEKMQ